MFSSFQPMRRNSWRPLVVIIGLLVALAPLGAGAAPSRLTRPSGEWIEPEAGNWHTWVLTSGSQFRPDAPPDTAGTRLEQDRLQALAQQRDGAAIDQIEFWDTGAP